jgi:hypothetical protein
VPKSLPHQVSAYSRWAKEDPAEQGRIMRAGFDQRFLREVDPNNELPEAERLRRAEAARRAYFGRLALASAKARRARPVGGGSVG